MNQFFRNPSSTEIPDHEFLTNLFLHFLQIHTFTRKQTFRWHHLGIGLSLIYIYIYIYHLSPTFHSHSFTSTRTFIHASALHISKWSKLLSTIYIIFSIHIIIHVHILQLFRITLNYPSIKHTSI